MLVYTHTLSCNKLIIIKVNRAGGNYIENKREGCNFVMNTTWRQRFSQVLKKPPPTDSTKVFVWNKKKSCTVLALWRQRRWVEEVVSDRGVRSLLKSCVDDEDERYGGGRGS